LIAGEPSFHVSSGNMQGGYLPEVKANNRECDCQGKQTGAPEERPENEPPIFGPLDPADTQSINGSPERQEVL
jgi:hypothetical protein